MHRLFVLFSLFCLFFNSCSPKAPKDHQSRPEDDTAARQKYEHELNRLQNRIKGLEYKLKRAERNLQECKTYKRKTRQAVSRLQQNISLAENNRKIFHPLLHELWPAIERRAPKFIARVKKTYPKFGPHSLVTLSKKKREVPCPSKKHNNWNQSTDYFYDSKDEYEWMLDNCVRSPDNNKFLVGPCIDNCDDDTEIRYVNTVKMFSMRIKWGGADTVFADRAWLDNNRFMYVDYSYYHLSPVLTICDTSGKEKVSCSPDYLVPPLKTPVKDLD